MLVTIALAAGVTASVAGAGEETGGPDLLEDGAKALIRRLMEEMITALDDPDGPGGPGRLADDMTAALEELRALIGGMTTYHLPEMLPNGDIIIRRRIPLQVAPPHNDGETEI